MTQDTRHHLCWALLTTKFPAEGEGGVESYPKEMIGTVKNLYIKSSLWQNILMTKMAGDRNWLNK